MKLKNAAVATIGWLAGLLTIALYIAGGLIHLWTIIIAFFESGFIAAAITFFLPVGSQIYWIFYISHGLDTFFNSLTMVIFAYLVGWFVVIGLGFLAAYFDKEEIDQPKSNGEEQENSKIRELSLEEKEDNEDEEFFFIGPNADYYKGAWNSFKERNNKVSWNWASFIFSSYWLVYRKMYAVFAVYTILLAFLSGFFMYLGYSYWFATLPIKIVLGLYGNYLYFRHFNKKTRDAKEYNITSSAFFQKVGGVSKLSVVLYIIVALVLNIYLSM